MGSARHIPPDHPVIEDSPAFQGAAGHPAMVLTTTILASSLSFIDGSIVNVGLPAIGHGLSADGAQLSWVVNGYLLPLSALLLTGGAAGDLFGRRRLLVWGLVLFAIASLICTFAPTFAWLLAGRVLQGTGAAMLMPNSLAILAATFDGARRGKAIGIWAAAGAVGAAGAPLLGGWLIDTVGWRWMFLMNLPIALAAIALAMRYVPAGGGEARPRLDVPGAVLASAALALLTWALTIVSEARMLPVRAAIALLIGICLGIGFILAEHRRGDRAMLPLALFRSRGFVGLTILTFLLYGALGGVLVLIPYVLIGLSRYSALVAGAALLPLPIVISVASPLMGRMAGKLGARLPLSIGPVIVGVGLLLAIRIPSDGNYWTGTFPAMVTIALGMAGAVAPLTTAVFASVQNRHAGVASGFNSAVARTGGLVATALLGGVLAARGIELAAGYGMALMVGAACAAMAGVVAFITIEGKRDL
ncbi:MFS transporter [Pinirhizobacter sp.]|jgi:EmrB/QacA subfamily drug resistance transporter|uniref:MFS transporter n=1 Tax=Pinirhizobacter sp. TaxID=2950432 RepID=UPI002F3ED943